MAGRNVGDWPSLVLTYARSLRKSITACRDGARVASSVVLRDDALLRSMELPLAAFAERGGEIASLVTLVQTAQHATIGFSISEQSRSSVTEDLGTREKRLASTPRVASIGPLVLGDADERFEAMLGLLATMARAIAPGAKPRRATGRRRAKPAR